MKELLVLQGFLAPPSHTDRLYTSIKQNTPYQPHQLEDPYKNIGRRQKQKIVDTVHALTDKSQQPIAIVGHSLGGLQGAIVAFENPKEIDEVVTLFSPVLFLRKKPETVEATAIYSSLDKYVRFPLGANPLFDRNINVQTQDHSAPLYRPEVHEIVIANLKLTRKPSLPTH